MLGTFLRYTSKITTHRIDNTSRNNFLVCRKLHSSTLAFLSFIFFITPSTSYGAVLINEIAWMGTDESYFCEWIELRNTGAEAVTLEGWELQIGDGPVRTLTEGEYSSLAISAGGHFVIERLVESCPNPVAGVSDLRLAFGNIANSNSSVTLIRPDGGDEDSVAGGENWANIGGDNETKATAQRTATGWITAVATPKSTNASVNVDTGTDEPAGSTSNATANNSSGREREERVLVGSLRIDAPTRAYVNQSVEFDVTPADGTKKRLVRYGWSFGDTGTSSAKSPEHTYRYAGNYVVMVESYYAKEYTRARHEIVVLPAQLTLARADSGDIQIHNDAPYEVDISNFHLQGAKGVRIPNYTVLLAGSTLTVPQERIEPLGRTVVSLSDPEGEIVATHNPWSVPPHVSEGSAETSLPPTVSSAETTSVEDSDSPEEVAEETERNEYGLIEAEPNPAEPMILRQSASAMDTVGREEYESIIPYVGLVGVLLLGTLGVYARGRRN